MKYERKNAKTNKRTNKNEQNARQLTHDGSSTLVGKLMQGPMTPITGLGHGSGEISFMDRLPKKGSSMA